MKLREYAEQKLEALGYEPKQVFELDDGTTIELVHPWLWSDEVQAAYEAAKADPDPATKKPEPSSVRIARAVLGKEQHKRFLATGGTSNEIVLAIETMRVPRDKGDADPKDE